MTDGWDRHRREQVEANLTTTPAQRLAWLEEAIRFAWNKHKLVVEPGGAVALAAVLARKVALQEDSVIVLSGGNIDPAMHARIVGD